ncbi:Pisatin demethylase [Cyphellophora attinorum]|uniref:Pisatin demethylase n=1 Tax=Cyphellophora attinorum TaxID=1664694 RepID=A0A0N1H7M3_9EURO|nr:Pisatin demethylase [Phialophora attinorum]KPI42555.1 Pisatin demethylase [Phialophora attinorum]
MLAAVSTILLASLLVGIVLRRISIAYKHGLRSIPGPRLARFTDAWRVHFVSRGRAHEDYLALHDKYGPIVRTAPSAMDISDPAAIPILYGASSPFLKSEFYSLFTMLYEGKTIDSLFSTRDPIRHRNLKRPIAQKFSMSSVRTLEPLVDSCTRVFLDSMHDLSGEALDLDVWLQWYAFDAIYAMTFSTSPGFVKGRRDVSGIIGGMDWILRYAAVVGQIPWLHGWVDPVLKFAMRVGVFDLGPLMIVTEMVEKAVREYDAALSEEVAGRQDFLAYLRQQSKSTGEMLGKSELQNHLMNNLLAGSDTTAMALRAVFYFVVKDGRVYECLQREIDKADAEGRLGEFVSYSECLEMKYLQACIKEALRMHPGVAFPLERVVPPDCTSIPVCGKEYYVPPGTVIGINPAVVQRDRDVFGADADDFRPERWFVDVSDAGDEARVRRMERTILAFGAGHRLCTGKHISLMEMGKFVPQILRNFRVEFADESNREWSVKTYWFAKQSGMRMKMTPRGKAERKSGD